MYQIIFSKKALKSLGKIPKDYKTKVEESVKKLNENPFQLDLKKMHSSSDATHRLRIGSYRIFLCIDSEVKEIIVANIKRRTSQTYQ